MATGRERQYDFELENMGYIVPRDQNGSPAWRVDPGVETLGKGPVAGDEERYWQSWHSGYGYSDFIVPNGYHYAVGIDASYPRQLIMAPKPTNVSVGGTANTSGFFEISSQLYLLAGRYVKQINLNNVTSSLSKDLGTGVTATTAVPFDGNIYIFLDSGNFWQLASGTYTQTSLAGKYGGTFWADAAAANAMIRAFSDSGDPAVAWVAHDSDPTVGGNYSATYDIGESTRPLTGIATRGRQALIAKTDGLYMVQTSGRAERVLTVPPEDSNGINTQVGSDGYVYYPSASGYFRYDPRNGEIWDVSPGRGLPNQSPVYGRVTAQAEFRQWRYAALWNGTDTYLMKGRRREDGEPGYGPMIWHGALVQLPSQQCWSMHVTHLTTPPRLYYGRGADAGYIRLSQSADNPLADSRSRYATAGSIYFPADNWGVPGMRWQMTGFTVDNTGLNSVSYASVYARLDHGGYQLLQTVQQQGLAPVNIPQGGDHRFGRLALRVDITNPSPSVTPVIRAIAGRAARRPRARDKIYATAFCSDSVLSRFSLPPRPSGAEQIQFLKAASQLGPMKLVDHWTGSPRERRVLVQPVPEQLIAQKGNDAADLVGLLTMEVLSGDDGVGIEVPVQARYGMARYGYDRYSVGTPRETLPARYGTAVYGTDIYG